MTELKNALKHFDSREALAHELGVSGQTIGRWERGQQIPLPALRLMRRLMDERKAKA